MADGTLEGMLRRGHTQKRPENTILRSISTFVDETESVEDRTFTFIKNLVKTAFIGYRELQKAKRRNKITEEETSLLENLGNQLVNLYDYSVEGINMLQERDIEERNPQSIKNEIHLSRYLGDFAFEIFMQCKSTYWGIEAIERLEKATKDKKRAYKMAVVGKISIVTEELYKTTGELSYALKAIEYKRQSIELGEREIRKIIRNGGGRDKIPKRRDFIAYRQAEIGNLVYGIVRDAIKSGLGPILHNTMIREGINNYRASIDYLENAQGSIPEEFSGLKYLERRMEGAEAKIEFLQRYLPEHRQTHN